LKARSSWPFAANRCEAVLFLVSRAWLNSPWYLKDLVLARRPNKRLFGVLIKDVPRAEVSPDLATAWQLVNLALRSMARFSAIRQPDRVYGIERQSPMG
jgi:hypothetical protein